MFNCRCETSIIHFSCNLANRTTPNGTNYTTLAYERPALPWAFPAPVPRTTQAFNFSNMSINMATYMATNMTTNMTTSRMTNMTANMTNMTNTTTTPVPYLTVTALSQLRDWRRWNERGQAEHALWGYAEEVARALEKRASVAEDLAQQARAIQADAETAGASELAKEMAVCMYVCMYVCPHR